MTEEVLFRGARLIDPATGTDEITDVLVAGGLVEEVGSGLRSARAEVIDCDGLELAPGLVDLHAHLREPGYEYKETIESGTRAAAAGGFTAVSSMANTDPVTDHAGIVAEIRDKAAEAGLADVFPVGAITKGLAGESMADRILLVMAKRNGRYIAGAINFIGADALYGRHWGAIEHHPFLHFELCYYQAIDFAIANKLATVEAGAQGEHEPADERGGDAPGQGALPAQARDGRIGQRLGVRLARHELPAPPRHDGCDQPEQHQRGGQRDQRRDGDETVAGEHDVDGRAAGLDRPGHRVALQRHGIAERAVVAGGAPAGRVALPQHQPRRLRHVEVRIAGGRAQLGRELLAHRIEHVRDDDPCPLGHEQARLGLPLPPRAPADQGDPSVELSQFPASFPVPNPACRSAA